MSERLGYGAKWQKGDNCDEDDCDKEVHKLTHNRDSQLGTSRHPDAPEVEFVCTTHGIVAER